MEGVGKQLFYDNPRQHWFFWLDGKNWDSGVEPHDGFLKYVHLGSGSGSTLCCVISNNTMEFLTLISIGYRALGFVDDFTLTPEENGDEPKTNQSFIDWLQERFNITIPSNGANFVKKPAQLWDEQTTDPFCLWCNKQISKGQ